MRRAAGDIARSDPSRPKRSRSRASSLLLAVAVAATGLAVVPAPTPAAAAGAPPTAIAPPATAAAPSRQALIDAATTHTVAGAAPRANVSAQFPPPLPACQTATAGSWPAIFDGGAGGPQCYVAHPPFFPSTTMVGPVNQRVFPHTSITLSTTGQTGGWDNNGAWLLSWNNLWDFWPLIRGSNGAYSNDYVGDSGLYAIPPEIYASDCYDGTKSYLYGRWVPSCTVNIGKGPYYGTPAGQTIPYTIFTASTHMNGGGYNTPIVTNCGGSCALQWGYWASFVELPVLLEPSPYAGFSSTDTVNGTQFTDTTKADLQITSWAWNFGDPGAGANNTSTAQSPIHRYGGAGPYHVTLTVTVADGQTDTYASDVTPTPLVDPVASFTADKFGPGQYQLTSTSTDPNGAALVETWSMAGASPSSATGRVVSANWTRPGTFDVTLTVTNPDGKTDSTTQQITIAAPTLSITATVVGGTGNLRPGDPVSVKVDVSAGADGVGNLTGLAFDPAGTLAVAPAGLLTGISGPSPPLPSALGPGGHVSVTFTATAGPIGRGSATATVVGTDAGGSPASGTGSVAVVVGAGALHVTITPSKNDFTLADGADGPVTERITATIAVENTLDTPITNVQLTNAGTFTLGLQSGTAVGDLGLVQLPGITPAPPGAVLGDLAPHAVVSVTATFDVSAGGDFLGTVLSTGDSSARGLGTMLLSVKQNVLVVFDASSDAPTSGLLKTGVPFSINAKLKNVSKRENLRVQVLSYYQGNVSGPALIPLSVTPPADGIVPGWVGKLDANSTEAMRAMLDTHPSMGTRATFTPKIAAWIVADDGTETAVDPARILIKEAAKKIDVSLDDSAPVPISADWGDLVGEFGKGFIVGMADMVGGLYGLVELGVKLQLVISNPGEWYRLYMLMSEATMKAWKGLSDADKAKLKEDTATTLALWTGMKILDAKAAINDRIVQWMQPAADGWVTGDYRAAARLTGELVGQNPDVLVQTATLFSKLWKGGSWIYKGLRGAEVAAEASQAERLAAKGRGGFLPGEVLNDGQELMWSADKVFDQNMTKLCSTWKIICIFRDRDPASLEWLASGLADRKQKYIQMKGIRQLDIDWLGFPSTIPNDAKYLGAGRNMQGVTAFRRPPPWNEVLGKLNAAGADAETIAKVRARWAQKAEEWFGSVPAGQDPVAYFQPMYDSGQQLQTAGSEADKMFHYAEDGSINQAVIIDGSGSGVATGKWEKRGFGYEVIDSADGGGPTIILKQQASKAKGNVWQYFTGDMDPVAFLGPDGRILDPVRREKLYQVLAYLGIQHPDQITWVNTAGVKKLNAPFDINAANPDALLAYMPSGKKRAVYLDGLKDIRDPNEAALFVGIAGSERYAVTTPVNAVDVERVVDPTRFPAYSAPKAFPGGPPTYSNQPGAPVVRPDGNGGLQRWMPDLHRWVQYQQPATPSTLRSGSAAFAGAAATNPLEIATQSAVMVPSTLGATSLAIADLATLELPSDSAWFAAGQTIVVDPGEVEEEQAIVVDPVTFTLDRPLRFEHPVGAMVAVVTATLASSPPSVTYQSLVPARLMETRSGAGLSTVDHVSEGVGVRAAGSVTELVVAGRGGVGASPAAVVLNVAVVDARGPGFVTVFPCGEDRPNAANLNYATGSTLANAVVAKVGAGGTVCVFTYGSVDLAVDVNGWFPTGAAYDPVVPARLLETRSGAGLSTVDHASEGVGVLGGGSVTELAVAGRGGMAADASAVVLNVAAVDARGPGFVTVYPCGEARPNAANLNVVAGSTVANLIVAKVGAGGKVCLFTYAATDLAVDVNGWFPAGADYTAVVPARILETRAGDGLSTIDHQAEGIGPRPAGSVTELVVAGRGGVPADASAVVLNVAVVDARGPGFVAVYPCGTDRPNAANLNYTTGSTRPNAVVAQVGAGGAVCIFTYAAVDLAVDVQGSFPVAAS